MKLEDPVQAKMPDRGLKLNFSCKYKQKRKKQKIHMQIQILIKEVFRNWVILPRLKWLVHTTSLTSVMNLCGADIFWNFAYLLDAMTALFKVSESVIVGTLDLS